MLIFPIAKIFLVIFIGFYAYRLTLINEKILKSLTVYVIGIAIPFLIFSNIVSNHDFENSLPVWIFFVLSLVIFLFGLLVGSLFSSKIKKEVRREFLSLISFQNAGYLPMNIALVLPFGLREEFLSYIFLYLLGYNILMWSVGSFLIFKRKNEAFNFGSILNPPALSVILSLIVIYAQADSFIPRNLLFLMNSIGHTSFVFSMCILGCWLAKRKSSIPTDYLLMAKVSFLKLVFVPLCFFIVVLSFEIYSLLGLFIIIQACMPSAASLPIIVNLRGADSGVVSQGVFFTHLVAIITTTIWIALFLKISNLTLWL